MTKRLTSYNNEYPVWLWLDTNNINFNEILDDEWILLETKLSEKDVLLSNFVAWHAVLNDWHLDEENIKATKEESWEYIFNKNKLEEIEYSFDNDDLQGVIGRVDLKDIQVFLNYNKKIM